MPHEVANNVVEQIQLMARSGKLSERASEYLLRATMGGSISTDLEDPRERSSNLAAAAAVAKLHLGLKIDDDVRLKSLIESLDAQWGVDVSNLSALTGCDLADIKRASSDPGQLPPEVKYRLAVRISYIAGAFDGLA